MLASVIASQAAVVGGVFIVTGSLKLADRHLALTAGRTALARVMTGRALIATWYLVALLEVGVGVAAATHFGGDVSLAAAGALLATVTMYALWARHVSPTADCGCTGSRSRAQITYGTFARNGVLGALLILAAVSHPTGLRAGGVAAVAIAAVETALILGVGFPELRTASRGRRRRRCESMPVDAAHALRQLRRTPIWREVRAVLSSFAVVDSWREGCWYYFAFEATYQASAATAVFSYKVDGKTRLNSCVFARSDAEEVLGYINMRTLKHAGIGTAVRRRKERRREQVLSV